MLIDGPHSWQYFSLQNTFSIDYYTAHDTPIVLPPVNAYENSDSLPCTGETDKSITTNICGFGSHIVDFACDIVEAHCSLIDFALVSHHMIMCNVPISLYAVSECYASWCVTCTSSLTTQLEESGN